MDNLIKTNLEAILNCQLSEQSWTQGSLSIRYGGLGIRKISDVALPAFLSSVHSSISLIGKILRTNYEISDLEDAKNAWSIACPSQSFPENPKSQRSWDDTISKLSQESLLRESCTAGRARLFAAGTREAGYWLHALPSRNMGTFLEPNTLRLSVCLRLGVPVCAPHLTVVVVNRAGRRNTAMVVAAVVGFCGIMVNLVPNTIGTSVFFGGFLMGIIVMGLYTAIAVALFPTHLRYLLSITSFTSAAKTSEVPPNI